jgi:hypothetical protein
MIAAMNRIIPPAADLPGQKGVRNGKARLVQKMNQAINQKQENLLSSISPLLL